MIEPVRPNRYFTVLGFIPAGLFLICKDSEFLWEPLLFLPSF